MTNIGYLMRDGTVHFVEIKDNKVVIDLGLVVSSKPYPSKEAARQAAQELAHKLDGASRLERFQIISEWEAEVNSHKFYRCSLFVK